MPRKKKELLVALALVAVTMVLTTLLVVFWFGFVGYGVGGCEEPCGTLGDFTRDNETLVIVLGFIVASALVWVVGRLWRR